MNEGEPKKNKKEGMIIFHRDSSEEEVLNLINRPTGFDDGQPKIVYNVEGLLESIEKDGEMIIFEVEAENAPGDNNLKLIEGIKNKIKNLQKDKKKLEELLNENINESKNIKNTLETQRLEGIIKYLENKIREISTSN